MALSSLSAQVKTESFEDRINSIVITFQMQKINYNGVDGFFIPLTGHKQMLLTLNDYIYLQDLVEFKNNRIKQLEGLELANFKLKTGLAITISFDVGATLIAAGLGLLCYNLAKQ